MTHRRGSRRTSRSRSGRGRVLPGSPAGVLLLSLALAAVLGGCSTPEPGPRAEQGPTSQERGDGAARDDDASGESPTGGTAADGPGASAVEAVRAELEAVAAADPTPDRGAVAKAFAAAGFTASAVEVSADRTPTGLDVDSIQGAAVQGGDCVFGEVRDGQVTVSVLPVLSGGRCFIGN